MKAGCALGEGVVVLVDLRNDHPVQSAKRPAVSAPARRAEAQSATHPTLRKIPIKLGPWLHTPRQSPANAANARAKTHSNSATSPPGESPMVRLRCGGGCAALNPAVGGGDRRGCGSGRGACGGEGRRGEGRRGLAPAARARHLYERLRKRKNAPGCQGPRGGRCGRGHGLRRNDVPRRRGAPGVALAFGPAEPARVGLRCSAHTHARVALLRPR